MFSEPGTYVFLDNGMPAWSLVVVVSDRGVECDPAPFKPSSPEQLVRLSVKWQRRPNLLPDRATIAGKLVYLGNIPQYREKWGGTSGFSVILRCAGLCGTADRCADSVSSVPGLPPPRYDRLSPI